MLEFQHYRRYIISSKLATDDVKLTLDDAISKTGVDQVAVGMKEPFGHFVYRYLHGGSDNVIKR